MINTIKKGTDCNIVVGQNGIVWIKGKNVDDELLAKEAIELVARKSFIEGLTEKVKEFLEEKEKTRKKPKETKETKPKETKETMEKKKK